MPNTFKLYVWKGILDGGYLPGIAFAIETNYYAAERMVKDKLLANDQHLPCLIKNDGYSEFVLEELERLYKGLTEEACDIHEIGPHCEYVWGCA